MHKPNNPIAKEEVVARAICLVLTGILIATVWWNRFLPMQDFPQHLFMAVVASEYENPEASWSENFEVRNYLGPYRASFLVLEFLQDVTDPLTSAKILATLYIFLVGLLAYLVMKQSQDNTTSWTALLFFPFCFHPMYFYGFINFTLSIPILILALLNLERFYSNPSSKKIVATNIALQACLFMLHPYTLLVFTVLALATTWIFARDKKRIAQGIALSSLALLAFLGWSMFNPVLSDGEGGLSYSSLDPKWWPFSWNLLFLATTFSGMNFTNGATKFVTLLWAILALVVTLKAWQKRREQPVALWLPVLLGLVLLGFFALPASIKTDGRYTFFNVRMGPIFCFLLVPLICRLPMGQLAGRTVAVLCVLLTCYSSYLHINISDEIESFTPIFDKMDSNAVVLTLMGKSPSEHLDPYYYAYFHQCFPFYYHILKGGGTNPDMFDRKMMPVGYQSGKKPRRPRKRELEKWDQYVDQYDYILVWKVTAAADRRLRLYCMAQNTVGPWTLYRID